MSRTNEPNVEPDLQRIRDVRGRLLREGSAVARSDGSVHDLFPIAISAAEGEALREWVVREGATRTVEIGLAYAISALYICEGLLANGDPEACHVAIDPFQDSFFSRCGLQFLEDAGVAEIVEHHLEESQTLLPRFVSGDRGFDLAFVDGNHRFERVFVDLYFLGRLVCPGGIIFLDDYQLPAIAKAASFFTSNLEWEVEEISPRDELHRWIVLRTSDSPDEWAFDHFIDF